MGWLGLGAVGLVADVVLMDLSGVANAPFVAEGEDTWAVDDQDALMGELAAGERELGGVPFRIAEERLIVLAGGERGTFAEAASIRMDEPAVLENVYLLNAAVARTWGNTSLIGVVIAGYADGTASEHEVWSAVDVGDWWKPGEPKEGRIVWEAESDKGDAGLTLTHLRLEEKPLAELRLEARGESVWLIAAVTGSEQAFDLPRKAPYSITAGEEWIPYEDAQSAAPGSVLDFSAMADAPAGKYGHIEIRDGQFFWENAPERRARFFGTNLCFSANFPTYEEADELAENLVRMGYNSVRLHHYDAMLVDEDASDSTTLDPERLDRLEYLIAACKKRGLYISIDLYTVRQTKAHELPEIGKPVRWGYKSLLPVLPSAFENWKTFVRNFLTHENPYTGMTLAEDPVLIGICPVNEDPVANDAGRMPEIAAIYAQAFEDWQKENDVRPESEEEKTRALARFYANVQTRANALYFGFLKNEIGVRAPLTGVNAMDTIGLTPIRAQLDYVDNHQYWDHPVFVIEDWELPYSFEQESATEAGAYLPRRIMPSRIFGKPFTCTEWNYTNPNQYRAEGGVLMGAYAALQDWDGIWRFAHSHSVNNLRRTMPVKGFDLATDPLSRMSELIGVALYLRQDVKPAGAKVAYLVNEEDATAMVSRWGAPLGFNEPIRHVGLSVQVGSIWVPDGAEVDFEGPVTGSPAFANYPGYIAPGERLVEGLEEEGILDEGTADLEAGVYRSQNGQLYLNEEAGVMKAVTERSEAFVLAEPGKVEGEKVSVSIPEGFATIGVIAVDGEPVEESGRLLLIHLTDLQNTNAQYGSERMRLLREVGELPHLIRAGQAEVVIETQRDLVVYPVDASGKRLKALEARVKEGKLVIKIDNARGPAVLAYELVDE